jgi:hypothetical protein
MYFERVVLSLEKLHYCLQRNEWEWETASQVCLIDNMATTSRISAMTSRISAMTDQLGQRQANWVF